MTCSLICDLVNVVKRFAHPIVTLALGKPVHVDSVQSILLYWYLSLYINILNMLLLIILKNI